MAEAFFGLLQENTPSLKKKIDVLGILGGVESFGMLFADGIAANTPEFVALFDLTLEI